MCYKCGDRYNPSHQYRRQLLNMEGADEDKGVEEEEEDSGEVVEETP